MNLALTLLRIAPFIVLGAAKQQSSRCAAALIITSCASVSLTLMIQPFLSSRRLGRSEPPTGTSPGSAEAEGAVGSHITRAASDDDTMLDAERKASPFCAGRVIVVNESQKPTSLRGA